MTGEKDAPAEMPGIYRIADEFERELFAWRNLPSRDGAALRACAYALAQKAEALFAPILAEKERELERLMAVEQADLLPLTHPIFSLPPHVRPFKWAKLVAKLQARALAAEAALAAERERCAVIADQFAAEHAQYPALPHAGRAIAAAIRAEGE